MFTIYIRYKQVEQYYRDHLSAESAKILRINYLSFVIGLISCLGLTVVANFQEINLRPVHLTGAITCFTCGLIYCILQTLISHLGYPLLNTYFIAKTRLALTTLMFISYLTSMTLGELSFDLVNLVDLVANKFFQVPNSNASRFLQQVPMQFEYLTAKIEPDGSRLSEAM